MKSTELVIQDHVILRQGLEILDGMVTTMESGGRIEIADIIAILKFFRTFAVEYKQTAEQESQLSDVEFALLSRRGSEFVRCSRRFSHMLRLHLEREDLSLLSIGEQPLTRANLSRLLSKYVKQPVAYPRASAAAASVGAGL
jgi:hemerythrin-like domain-containing protein